MTIIADYEHQYVNSIRFSHADKVRPIVKRSFSKVDFVELGNMVQQIDISTYDQNSTELLLQQWRKSFTDILDIVAPIITFPMRRHRHRAYVGLVAPSVESIQNAKFDTLQR